MFITRAIERGVDVKVIAEWQGHKDGGKLILDTYSHVNRAHSQRMAQLMTDGLPENVVPISAGRLAMSEKSGTQARYGRAAQSLFRLKNDIGSLTGLRNQTVFWTKCAPRRWCPAFS